MALRSPVAGPRIVPFGEPRLSTDRLPNGRLAFRVTQRFDDRDAYFGGLHGALDLGNYYCGDALYASQAGYISNRRDIYGALIVEIRAGNGDIVGYGHVSRFARAHGSYVWRGMVVAYVGDTGLGAVCHVHYYFRPGGASLVNPWPLLEQNQQAPAPAPGPTVYYVRFNDGVQYVNIRSAPDSRKDNVFAVAGPKYITRKATGTVLALTSSRIVLVTGGGNVAGPDGITYFRIRLPNTTADVYCAKRFMHRDY